MTSTKPVLFDFETRSRADLKAVGGRNYWAHPSTQVLCCCWHDLETGETGTGLPPTGRVLAAHNATGFDRFGIERMGAPDAPGIDTAQLARRAGLPGSLAGLGEYIGEAKDTDASHFTVSLSSVRRPPHIEAKDWREYTDAQKRAFGKQPPYTVDAAARVEAYCKQDVKVLAEAWPLLEPWLDVDVEAGRVDRVINERGVELDVDLVLGMLERDVELAEQAVDAAAASLGWAPTRVRTVINSPIQLARELGTEDVRAETIEHIEHPLAVARRATASIIRGKLLAGLQRVSPDGRLRDMHRYYGAHTGRWSGQGMQLQNLPRPSKRYEHWQDSDIESLRGRVHEADSQDLDLLIRACITAAPGHELAVCDFSGIEARALAWAAGDGDALDVFERGLDPYRVAAARIFGCSVEDVDGTQRQLGKIAELALGYGQGARSFASTAERKGRVDLDAVGVSAQAVVRAWREQHAPIVDLWDELDAAWRAAACGQDGEVSCFRFLSEGGDVRVELPSGRPVVYSRPVVCGRDMTYGPRGAHVYGGLIAENLIQALCRDLLSDALVRAEAAGLRPVMHVHDEIVCEVPTGAAHEAYRELQALMRIGPAWSAGLPLDAKGFVGRRYRK